MSTRALLFKKSIHQRAIKVALVVGTLLCLINQGDAIFNSATSPINWLKLGLTYLVPYCVSLYSAVSALSQKA